MDSELNTRMYGEFCRHLIQTAQEGGTEQAVLLIEAADCDEIRMALAHMVHSHANARS